MISKMLFIAKNPMISKGTGMKNVPAATKRWAELLQSWWQDFSYQDSLC
jgi:hypothetical protein